MISCLLYFNPGVDIRYLDQGLHRTPNKMAALVQEQIDEAAHYAKRVVLGYGLCSNGIVGVEARRQGLLVPPVPRLYRFLHGVFRGS